MEMGSVKVPEMPQRDEQRLWGMSLRPLAAIALRFLGRSSDASWKASSFYVLRFPSGCLDVWKLKGEERTGKKEKRGKKNEREWGEGWGQEGDIVAVGCRFRTVQGLDG